MSDEAFASEVQATKFDQFLSLPNASELLVACQFVAEAAGLAWEEIGVRWGITVCASKTSLLRLNVGNRLLFDARPDGDFELFIVHPIDRPALWGDHIDAYKGFDQVRDSVWLLLKGIEELAEVLDEPGLAEEVKAHADASGRSLPRPEWHNPLVEALFDDLDLDLDDIDQDLEESDVDLDGCDPEDDSPKPDVEGGEAETDARRPGGSNDPKATTAPVSAQRSGGATVPGRVMDLQGRGSKKSRPFDIDKRAEYFVVRWAGSDSETTVSVIGLPPYSCFESFEGAKGEGVVYESGRFYIEVDSDGDWSLSVDVLLGTPETAPATGVLASFSGKGDGKTRPFNVPKGCEYFVVKWTANDDEVEVTVHGIEPTSSFDWFRGGPTGEGLVYESGRFYAEIETEGEWSVEVTIE